MFNYNFFKKIYENNKIRFKNPSYIKLEISDRLIDRLDFLKINPKIIYIEGIELDNIIKLKNKFPISQFITSFSKNVDLIISNNLLNLNENIINKLNIWEKYLHTNGIILFTIFGNYSLQEINKAWEIIDSSYRHINHMFDLHDIGDILKKIFHNIVMDSECLKFRYNNFTRLFNDIREINEPLADSNMRKTFIGKNRWKKFTVFLEKTGLNITYEVIYAYASKKN